MWFSQDIEQLRQQLKDHRQLNNDVVSERHSLRNMIGDAAKIGL